MKRHLSILILILGVSLNTFSKNNYNSESLSDKIITIKGTVINENTSEFIPFVNIAISGTFYGTVSNRSGQFILQLPQPLKDKTITFSCIGFETFELQNTVENTSQIIKLKPLDYQVDEITVMPDSSLRSLILMAYEKIPENYPNYNTYSKGFYRSAMKKINGEYLTLVEAMLDVFKTSYKTKNSGQIKINKSRKYIAPGMDSINNVLFYGGHFIPHSTDIVKKRQPIIKASDNYIYKLTGMNKIDNRELYVIHFEPKNSNSEGYIGEMYIDKKTLAFEKFEYHSNEEKLKWREKELFSKLSSKKTTDIVIYAPIDGKYYLKSVSYVEVFENMQTKQLLEKFSEYTLTEITDKKATPFSYNEISSYSDVISKNAITYIESDWHDYPTIQLDKTMLMSKNISDSIFTNGIKSTRAEQKQNEKREKKIKLLYVLEQFSSELNVFPQTVNITSGKYSIINSLGDQLVSNTFSSSNVIWQYEASLAYSLAKRLDIIYFVAENMSSKYFLESHKIGFSFNLPLKSYGKKLFLTIQPGYKFQNTMLAIGESDYLLRFENDELVYKDGESKVFWGEKSNGFDGRMTLRYQISRQFWINAFTGYYSSLNNRTVLRFEDKSGNIFSKKNKMVDMNNTQLDLQIDNISIEKPTFEIPSLYFGFGIVMTI